jgi:hypothetical protein
MTRLVLVMVVTVMTASVASAAVHLPGANIDLEIDGWDASFLPQTRAGVRTDIMQGPDGHSLVLNSGTGQLSCRSVELIIKARGGTPSTPVPDGYAYAYGKPGSEHHDTCLETKDGYRWVLTEALDPAVLALLAAVRAKSEAPELGHAGMATYEFPFELDASWKHFTVDGVRYFVDMRPGGPAWQVAVAKRLPPPGVPCEVPAKPDPIPGLPFPATVLREYDDDTKETSFSSLVCFEHLVNVQIYASRTPTEAEMKSLSDEVFVRGYQRIDATASTHSYNDSDTSYSRPDLMGIVIVGLAGASSKPVTGERGSGVLFNMEFAAMRAKAAGPAMDVGLMAGYSFHGGAGELRASGGLGVQHGPLGLIVGGGAIVSLLGEPDSMAGDFTRHVGLIGSARLLVVSRLVTLSVGAAATVGLNADQERLDVAFRVKSYIATARYIEHGDLGGEIVARTVLVGVGGGI